MILRQTLDELWPELPGVRLLNMVLAWGSHPADGAALEAVGGGHQAGTSTLVGRCSALRIHHKPLIVLLSVVLLHLLCRLPVNVVLGYGAKVCASISLNNDQVARLHRQA